MTLLSLLCYQQISKHLLMCLPLLSRCQMLLPPFKSIQSMWVIKAIVLLVLFTCTVCQSPRHKILSLNYLHLYQLLLFPSEKYFSSNLLVWLLITYAGFKGVFHLQIFLTCKLSGYNQIVNLILILTLECSDE